MNTGGRNPNRNQLTKFFLASSLLVLALSVQNVRPENIDIIPPELGDSNCELGEVLQKLLTPDDLLSIHVKALRNKLLRILNNQALLEPGNEMYNDETFDDKRSISSLARSGQFPNEYKRNLGSLAKSGYSRMGRSIATLAKNGQLPTLQAPEEEITEEEEKRSISSLAKAGYLKRNLASLVRSGFYPGKRYNDMYDDKRNIGALARNGYLKRDIDNFLTELNQKRYIGAMARQYNLPNGKRNIGALARNGELYFNRNYDGMDSEKRNLQAFMKSGGLGGKRTLASLVRNQNVPYFGKYGEYKRNIAAVARDWALPNHSTNNEKTEEDKRNVAALLRQDSYLHSINRNSGGDAHPTPDMDDGLLSEDKRNLAALKAQATSGYNIFGNRNSKRSVPVNEGGDKLSSMEIGKHSRSKRNADDYILGSDEYSMPVMQNSNGFDYEDFLNALSGYNDKRFLGSVARGGWFRGGAGGQVRFNPVKRHIGSLARLGWLPSFRYARSRFGRSGRSVLPPLERFRKPTKTKHLNVF